MHTLLEFLNDVTIYRLNLEMLLNIAILEHAHTCNIQ